MLVFVLQHNKKAYAHLTHNSNCMGSGLQVKMILCLTMVDIPATVKEEIIFFSQ